MDFRIFFVFCCNNLVLQWFLFSMTNPKIESLHIYRTDTLVIHTQDNWDSEGDIKQRQNIWHCLFGFHTINIQSFHQGKRLIFSNQFYKE